MIPPARILSLNLGSQSIALAEFRTRKAGGLVLQRFVIREIPIENAAEGARHAQVQAALQEIVSEWRLKHAEVNYAVSSHATFARFVNLPAVEEEKIERIIAFEAQQNVPFSIDDVVWDYQLVAGGADEQIQVLLVAIKADLLETLNASVENAGLRTNLVDLASMALYNAFRHNYPELSDCSLVVDIGARTTNLLFTEPGKVFSRSIPIGGGCITAAIAREFGEPLAAAELRKRREGFVTVGGAYATPDDPDLARVSNVVRGTITRLHAELLRSISHYRAQQEGGAPQRVFLAGGSASMPCMREFFGEKLQLPVEFLNPFRKVAAATPVIAEQVSKGAHLLGEVVGLALRSATACPMELNLAPASVRRLQTLRQHRPLFLLATACLVLALLAWSAFYWRAAQLERGALNRVQVKIETMRRLEARMQKVRRDLESFDREAAPLIAALQARSFWPGILQDLNQRLPKHDIWITELLPLAQGKPVGVSEAEGAHLSFGALAAPVTPNRHESPNEQTIDGLFVRGLYLFNPKQQEVVVDYFRNLTGSPWFNIDPNNQSRVIKPSMPTNTEWAFPYELRLDLRRPLALP